MGTCIAIGQAAGTARRWPMRGGLPRGRWTWHCSKRRCATRGRWCRRNRRSPESRKRRFRPPFSECQCASCTDEPNLPALGTTAPDAGMQAYSLAEIGRLVSAGISASRRTSTGGARRKSSMSCTLLLVDRLTVTRGRTLRITAFRSPSRPSKAQAPLQTAPKGSALPRRWGVHRRRRWASAGVRLPLYWLQERQAHAVLTHVLLPPRLSGRMWSMVMSRRLEHSRSMTLAGRSHSRCT